MSKSNQKLQVGIDIGEPGGDESALSLGYKGKVWTYVGDEFDAIQAYIEEAYKKGYIDGGIAELTKGGKK